MADDKITMEISLFSFLLVLLLGILPSVVWLLYYLRKDVHPEPKEIIFQLFLIGFVVTPFVGFAEILLQQGASSIYKTPLAFTLIIFLAALWEEGVKYLCARMIFHHEKEFDELTDGMIYLIVVALGFAASENMIIALGSLLEERENVLALLGLRALGATLLHTLASGIFGYFLARGIFLKERAALLKGLVGATVVHALFNWFILQASLNQPKFTFLVVLLLTGGLAIILRDFHNLKVYDNR